jgi:DNA-binding NtrC family response regulator
MDAAMRDAPNQVPLVPGAGGRTAVTILVADRNPHVRDFLRREMAADGYRVRLAEKAQEVVRALMEPAKVNLLVIDPDLTGAMDCHLADELRRHLPTLPVIVHGFFSVLCEWREKLNGAAFIEKNANSVERIKEAIRERLARSASPTR